MYIAHLFKHFLENGSLLVDISVLILPWVNVIFGLGRVIATESLKIRIFFKKVVVIQVKPSF